MININRSPLPRQLMGLMRLPNYVLRLIVRSLHYVDANDFASTCKTIDRKLSPEEVGITIDCSKVTTNQLTECRRVITEHKISRFIVCSSAWLNLLNRSTIIKRLKITDRFDDPFTDRTMPRQLTELDLGFTYRQMTDNKILPETLRYLKCHDTAFRTIPRIIELDCMFSKSINEPLPDSLKQITVRSENAAIECSIMRWLPERLEKLKLISCGAMPLWRSVIPNRLIHLELLGQFNQPMIDGLIPDMIERLVFGNHFNQTIHIFPPNLRWLTFGTSFNQTLNHNAIPKTLINVRFNVTGYFDGGLASDCRNQRAAIHSLLGPIRRYSTIVRQFPFSIDETSSYERYVAMRVENL